MITLERIIRVLERLPQLRIGLLGDLFLDRYLELTPGVHELSIETGLEAYQIDRVRNSPGALGTVINNFAALGVGQLVPVTVLGDDGHGYDLRKELQRLPVDDSQIIFDGQRLTPTYTKPMRCDNAGVWQELNRLDVRTREPLRPSMVELLVQRLRQVFHACDGLVVLDQINESNWGVVNEAVREALVELLDAQPQKLVFVDSRRHLGEFRCGMLKGNRAEVLAAAGVNGEGDEVLAEAVQRLARRTRRPAFCTAGERGIYVAELGEAPTLVPGYAVSGPIDIVGAGDAATSGVVAALLCGLTCREAAGLGNLVASITIQQLGTTGTASPEQVLRRAQEALSRA